MFVDEPGKFLRHSSLLKLSAGALRQNLAHSGAGPGGRASPPRWRGRSRRARQVAPSSPRNPATPSCRLYCAASSFGVFRCLSFVLPVRLIDLLAVTQFGRIRIWLREPARMREAPVTARRAGPCPSWGPRRHCSPTSRVYRRGAHLPWGPQRRSIPTLLACAQEGTLDPSRSLALPELWNGPFSSSRIQSPLGLTATHSRNLRRTAAAVVNPTTRSCQTGGVVRPFWAVRRKDIGTKVHCPAPPPSPRHLC